MCSGVESFQGIFGHHSLHNYPSEGMKGAVYKENPLTFLDLKETFSNPVGNIPPTELSRVFANKIRRVDACLHAREGPFPTSVETSVSIRNAFVLTYRHFLNMLIVCSRCTGSSGSFCM
jgi:hypothetical protein